MKKLSIIFGLIAFIFSDALAQNTSTSSRNSNVNISNVNKTKKTITRVKRPSKLKPEALNPIFINTLDVPIYIFANPKHNKIEMVDITLLPNAQIPVNSKSIDTVIVKRGSKVVKVPKICFSVGLSPDGSDAKSYAATYTNGHIYLVKDKTKFHRNDGRAYEVPLTNYYQMNKGIFTIKNGTEFNSFMILNKGFSFSGVTLASQGSTTVTDSDISKMRAASTGIYPLEVLCIKEDGDAPVKATIFITLPEKGGEIVISDKHFKITNDGESQVRLTIKNNAGLSVVIVCNDKEVVLQPRGVKVLKPNYGQNNLLIKWYDNGWRYNNISFIADNTNCVDLVYYKGQFALKPRQ